MKRYTSPEQTAKLIELGFEKPTGIGRIEVTDDVITFSRNLIVELTDENGPKFNADYTIGELIELLPTIVDDFSLWIGRDERSDQWFVKYSPHLLKLADELIDALYEMTVKRKEEL